MRNSSFKKVNVWAENFPRFHANPYFTAVLPLKLIFNLKGSFVGCRQVESPTLTRLFITFQYTLSFITGPR